MAEHHDRRYRPETEKRLREMMQYLMPELAYLIECGDGFRLTINGQAGGENLRVEASRFSRITFES